MFQIDLRDVAYQLPARTPRLPQLQQSITSALTICCSIASISQHLYNPHRNPIRRPIHCIATSETFTEKARQKHFQSATTYHTCSVQNEYGSSDPVEKN